MQIIIGDKPRGTSYLEPYPIQALSQFQTKNGLAPIMEIPMVEMKRFLLSKSLEFITYYSLT
jgi:hypothetical protein